MKQTGFICLRCVIPDGCKPDHKNCLYNLEGKDVRLSQKVRGLERAIKQLQSKLDSLENPRKFYFQKHYLLNKEKKRKYYQNKKQAIITD